MTRNILLRGAALTLCLMVCLSVLFGCADDDGERELTERVFYNTDRIEEYVRLDRYTELSIPLSSEDASRSEALWDALLARAEILSLPEEQVNYYAEQSKTAYRHYAEEHDLDYPDVLAHFETSEERILAEAQQMVKGDLVYHYILADTGLSLTKEEKENLFDRYATKFADDYGYTKDYVTEQMAELVYDAMLYDKTTQYLMDRNTFEVAAETE